MVVIHSFAGSTEERMISTRKNISQGEVDGEEGT